MNIALFGYGRMGKEIESFARSQGHHISAKVNREHPKEEFDYSQTDVIIEFSLPEFARENIKFAIDIGIPIIVGTTGWYDHLYELTAYSNKNKGCFLYTTNFSLGVNLFYALNKSLAKLMSETIGYTTNIVETHHTEKLDSPSGTAISLASQIIAVNNQYTEWVNVKKDENMDRAILPIESIRLPNVPGTHEVNYESTIDTISIKHTAHNRKGFAQGSVIAAQWIIGKKGIFTMQDVLNF